MRESDVEKILKHKRILTCREASALMQPYLDDQLTDRELTDFLGHIRSCHKCRDELETNYMVDRTVRFLNGEAGEDVSLNLTPLLAEDIERKILRLQSRRNLRILRRVILGLVLVLIVLVALDLTHIFNIMAFIRNTWL